MSSAQREHVAEDEAGEFRLVPAPAELKQEVAARLAAHRRRRGGTAASGVATAAPGERSERRGDAIAAAVAERYARTPSYRAVLAEQARRAAEEASAKSEVARRNAEAAAAVQQELLGELELWVETPEFHGETELSPGGAAAANVSAAHDASGSEALVVAGLRVRLYEDLGQPAGVAARIAGAEFPPDDDESRALDAEIAFRKSPVFEQHEAPWNAGDAETPVPLPANLLEFPRQLVAARKARPRLAEGPLRDEAPRSSQLRIFEVEPEQISIAPAVAAGSEWSTSIRLDAHTPGPAVATDGVPLAPSLVPPQTAPLSLRTMATLVDAGLVLAASVLFVAVFARVAGQVPTGLRAAVALAAVAVTLFLLYQLLFFSFGDQTPGMRYAKIGLCTLSDENPTRSAMRKRILAQVAAAAPLGLGLLWSLLDEDGLGWHDRLSRMYQRAY